MVIWNSPKLIVRQCENQRSAKLKFYHGSFHLLREDFNNCMFCDDLLIDNMRLSVY